MLVLQINTNKLNARKQVKIDDHVYTVRRAGAGEQLALQQLYRRAGKVQKKLLSEDYTESDELEAEQLANSMMDIFVGLYDDGEDGSKSRKLVESLTTQEIQELSRQIFPEDNIVDPEES